MHYRSLLLAGAAALALGACGKKDGEHRASPAEISAEGASPLDRPFQLKDAEAVEADAIFALLPPPMRPAYESAAFDKNLGATVVTGLVFHQGEDAVRIGRAEFYGVDLEAVERVREGERALDAPFESVFQKIRLYGIESGDGGGEPSVARIGGVELDRLRIRRGGWSAEGSDAPAFRFMNAVDLAGLYVKDLTIEGQDDAGEGLMTLDAVDIRVSGIGSGKVAAIIGRDFEYEIQQTERSRANMAASLGPQGAMLLNGPLGAFLAPARQRTKMEIIDWRGVDVSGWMNRALAGETPAYTDKNLVSLGSMKISNTETFIDDRLAASVEETTFTAREFTWFAPTKLESRSKGGFYDFSAYLPSGETAALEIVKKHALDKVKAESALDWTWNSKNGQAALKSAFETEGLADLDFSLDLTGLEIQKIAAAAEQGEEGAFAKHAALKSMRLHLADEKMLDAIFDLAGLQMNQSGKDLRASAPAMIRLSGMQVAALSPRLADYVEAVADFVGEGGSLEIAMKPEPAVEISDLGVTLQRDPQSAPERLDLTVTHKK